MKRLGIFLCNWFAILTLPVWGGIGIVVVVIKEAINNEYGTRKALTGKKLLWS